MVNINILFGVVQTASPINQNIVNPMVELHSAANRPAGVGLEKRVQPIKDRVVLVDIEPLELSQLVLEFRQSLT
ncbi:hypothetical protein ACFX13_030712 [Malus domestica]